MQNCLAGDQNKLWSLRNTFLSLGLTRTFVKNVLLFAKQLHTNGLCALLVSLSALFPHLFNCSIICSSSKAAFVP